MSLPRHLRSYKDKSKDEVARDFFNVPSQDAFLAAGEAPSLAKNRGQAEKEGLAGMDISAVLSVEGKEEVYVSRQIFSAARSRSSCVELIPLYRLDDSASYLHSCALSAWIDGPAALLYHCSL